MVDTIFRKELKESILEQGLQDTNFFNGRLLTAADLALVQKASRRRDQLLARAIGAGVVCGLEVSLVTDATDGKPPILAVTNGLAVNRSGQMVALPVNIEVALAKEKPEKISPAGFFDICEPIQQNGKPLPGKGVYLFVARPALDYQGSAPRRGFGQDAKVEDCDRDMVVEGVQFRLVMMDINQLENLSLDTRQALTELLAKLETPGPVGSAAQNKLRNWIAHACFGTEELTGFIEDPFSRPGGISPFEFYGAVDHLLEEGLIDDCDVPLALVCWTATGVKWVDMWSVRRKPLSSDSTLPLSLPLATRRLAEGEAMFYQFQEQVASITRPNVFQSELSAISAVEFFRYLPPAGILPISGIGRSRGFNAEQFFLGLTTRNAVFMEGVHLMKLLKLAVQYPPFDLTSKKLVWQYFVRENIQAVEADLTQPLHTTLIFASGYLPYQGDPQYDLSYWDYANYGPGVNFG